MNKLILKNQISKYSEKLEKSQLGNTKLHYVVKNTPFEIQLALPAHCAGNFSFHTCYLEATLHYDLPSLKEITLVNQNPVKFEVLPHEDGSECKVLVRVQVLSNHYEKSNFLIKFRLYVGNAYLDIFSEPVKCVSKVNQIRKKIAEKNGKIYKTNSRKRPRSETAIFENSMGMIKEALEKNSFLLTQLVQAQNFNNAATPAPVVNYNTNNSTSYAPPLYNSDMVPQQTYVAVPQPPAKVSPEKRFENAFTELVAAYSDLNKKNNPVFTNLSDTCMPPTKRRKLVSAPQNNEQVKKMLVDISNDVGVELETKEKTACDSSNCQYKLELEQISNMYMDVLINDTVMM
eukprot:TRINITY_DN10955_c0_g1_i1.p1 TRINITY_DN10955_c0_g1~~TRINITY_DN10955_c0_g1_i1.p1  ORF type:complete len:345 (-),score=62.79 TRINITY_DN10955_c0_g1_i1:142-1176(-)